MSPYERYLLPWLIDWVCAMPPAAHERAKIVPRAHGEVLEIGIGTGHNLAYYAPHQVVLVTGIDPGILRRKIIRRARAAGIEVKLLPLSAESIPAEDAHFDTLVSTFTLCSIPDVEQALAEMHRVLKPTGRFLYLEHGAAPDLRIRRWQDRLTPMWKPIAGGCHLNRDIPQLITEAGFEILEQHNDYIRGPRILSYIYRGEARLFTA
jgi:ubiquinone/menaquinone biosynthesis C-methylase UbiE